MRALLLVLVVLCLPANALAAECEGATEGPSEAVAAVDVAVTTAVSVELLKRTFKEPRPEGSTSSGYAFPSGHATLAFALARVASEHHPKQRTLWYLIAAGVAWSRVAENAHDWDDVMAGAVLGNYIGQQSLSRGGIVVGQWDW
jgi:membrane-associated phospholipid phosphatase